MFIVIARRAACDAAERSSAGWRITSGCLVRVWFVFCVYFFSFLRLCGGARRSCGSLLTFIDWFKRPSVEHFKESIGAKWYLKKKKDSNSYTQVCCSLGDAHAASPEGASAGGGGPVVSFPPTSQLLGERERSRGTLDDSRFGCSTLSEQ